MIQATAQKEPRARVRSELARLKRRLAQVAANDFFQAPGKRAAGAGVEELERRLQGEAPGAAQHAIKALRPGDLRGKTWVTRRHVEEDRIASAWLVRRFIDPRARFRFVPGRGYSPKPHEVRFDMFEGEFTHAGELCTFEVLLEAFQLRDPALRAIAEVVHDIDLKDGKYHRPETAGMERLIGGLFSTHRDDEARLRLGLTLFDALHAAFRASL